MESSSSRSDESTTIGVSERRSIACLACSLALSLLKTTRSISLSSGCQEPQEDLLRVCFHLTLEVIGIHLEATLNEPLQTVGLVQFGKGLVVVDAVAAKAKNGLEPVGPVPLVDLGSAVSVTKMSMNREKTYQGEEIRRPFSECALPTRNGGDLRRLANAVVENEELEMIFAPPVAETLQCVGVGCGKLQRQCVNRREGEVHIRCLMPAYWGP